MIEGSGFGRPKNTWIWWIRIRIRIHNRYLPDGGPSVAPGSVGVAGVVHPGYTEVESLFVLVPQFRVRADLDGTGNNLQTEDL